MGKKRKSLSSSSKPKPKPKSKSKPKPAPIPESESEDDDLSESSSSPSSSSSSSEKNQQPESSDSDADSSSSSSSDDEASKRDSIKTLLEPFSKDQLIGIVKEAAAKNPTLFASVESDPIHRKLFVHGLGWETTSESLASFFSQYGVVEDCQVVTDKSSGKSKGYAFLIFAARAGARKALREPQKRIGGRVASCQLASAGPAHLPGSDAGRKLYVANVGPQVNPERLREFFASFGEIEQGPLGLDKGTGRFRGFAMFVYRTEEGMRKALEEPEKVFEGFKMPCSVAVAKAAKSSAPAAVSGEMPSGSVNVGIASGALPVYNPGGPVFMGQNPAAFGVMNPVMGMGYSPGFGAPGLNMKVGATPTVGGFGMQAGFSETSPTMIGAYGNQAPLQGFGAYQMGPPQASGGAATRHQHGESSSGATSPPYGRR